MVINNFPEHGLFQITRLLPLFEKDDCMDAGGRATQEQLPRGWGDFLNKSPFFKGGSYL
jgi:hypothetical protein